MLAATRGRDYQNPFISGSDPSHTDQPQGPNASFVALAADQPRMRRPANSNPGERAGRAAQPTPQQDQLAATICRLGVHVDDDDRVQAMARVLAAQGVHDEASLVALCRRAENHDMGRAVAANVLSYMGSFVGGQTISGFAHDAAGDGKIAPAVQVMGSMLFCLLNATMQETVVRAKLGPQHNKVALPGPAQWTMHDISGGSSVADLPFMITMIAVSIGQGIALTAGMSDWKSLATRSGVGVIGAAAAGREMRNNSRALAKDKAHATWLDGDAGDEQLRKTVRSLQRSTGRVAFDYATTDIPAALGALPKALLTCLHSPRTASNLIAAMPFMAMRASAEYLKSRPELGSEGLKLSAFLDTASYITLAVAGWNQRRMIEAALKPIFGSHPAAQPARPTHQPTPSPETELGSGQNSRRVSLPWQLPSGEWNNDPFGSSFTVHDSSPATPEFGSASSSPIMVPRAAARPGQQRVPRSLLTSPYMVGAPFERLISQSETQFSSPQETYRDFERRPSAASAYSDYE